MCTKQRAGGAKTPSARCFLPILSKSAGLHKDVPHSVLVRVTDPVHLLESTLESSFPKLTDNLRPRFHQRFVVFGTHGQ